MNYAHSIERIIGTLIGTDWLTSWFPTAVKWLLGIVLRLELLPSLQDHQVHKVTRVLDCLLQELLLNKERPLEACILSVIKRFAPQLEWLSLDDIVGKVCGFSTRL